MNQCKRLRRSLAWAMAFKPEELKQLIAGCCDGIVLDLEDGVLITQKKQPARQPAKYSRT